MSILPPTENQDAPRPRQNTAYNSTLTAHGEPFDIANTTVAPVGRWGLLIIELIGFFTMFPNKKRLVTNLFKNKEMRHSPGDSMSEPL